MSKIILVAVLFVAFNSLTQVSKDSTEKSTKKWYDKISIRGYTQIRYNGLLQTNEDLECEQCDKSWGGENGFFIRRMRIIFFGQISPRVYFYIQPDFASAPSSSTLHFTQLRDAYFDVGVDKVILFPVKATKSLW